MAVLSPLQDRRDEDRRADVRRDELLDEDFLADDFSAGDRFDDELRDAELRERDPPDELREVGDFDDLRELELFDDPRELELFEELREPELFDEARLAGTLPPVFRASDRPIAIACLRLVTFLPECPLRNVPCLRSCIAFFTLLCAVPPYLAITCLLCRCSRGRSCDTPPAAMPVRVRSLNVVRNRPAPHRNDALFPTGCRADADAAECPRHAMSMPVQLHRLTRRNRPP
jgi:hypothetical protein